MTSPHEVVEVLISTRCTPLCLKQLDFIRQAAMPESHLLSSSAGWYVAAALLTPDKPEAAGPQPEHVQVGKVFALKMASNMWRSCQRMMQGSQ